LLAEHFERRFGNQRWAVFDRRRKLCLVKPHAGPPRIVEQAGGGSGEAAARDSALSAAAPDQWEELWRSYFKAAANEERKNPRLQKSFMPRRYWKDLPEMRE
jgi:probable DNA metabolism protein